MSPLNVERLRLCLRLAGLLGYLCAFAAAAAHAQTPWSSGGADISNSHASLSSSATAGSATQINPSTASRLAVKWSRALAGPVNATPTVEAGGLYVPDASGVITKFNPTTGATIWTHKIADYTKLYGSISRSAPAIGGSVIVFGDYWAHDAKQTSNIGARVIAVNKSTGALAWVAVVDKTSQWSEILGSPVIYGNLVYVGLASWEEAHTNVASFRPSFRGSVVALDLGTGRIVWQRYLAPSGYTGVGAPGTNPVIYPATHSVIVTTGNNYSIPAKVGQCIQAARPNIGAMDACLDPTDYVNSAVALDLTTGRVLWTRQLGGPDTWNIACQSTNATIHGANCPYGPSYDYDFASQPNLISVPSFQGVRDDRGGTSKGVLLGAGQKSGVYWGLNPANGGVYWSAKIGNGGIEWGSAVNTDDHNAVYVALNNSGHYTNKLAGQNGKTLTWNAGAWASVNVTNGHVNWQVPTYGKDLGNTAYGGSAPGAVAFTNRVVFGGSSSGYFTAMNASTGTRLWAYGTGLSVNSGPAIFNETVYWGSGYRTGTNGKANLFAFTVRAP